MDLTKLSQYKDRMVLAKKMNDEEEFKKYFKLYSEEYKKITGKKCLEEDFEEEK